MTDVVDVCAKIAETEMEVNDTVPKMASPKRMSGGSFVVPSGRRLSRMDSKNLSEQVANAAGSFSINKDELAAVVRNIDRKESKLKHAKRMKWAMGAAIAALAVAMACTFAVTFAAVQAGKESHVTDGVSSQLTSATDSTKIVQTAAALVKIPLLVMPVLPASMKLERLTVTYTAFKMMSLPEGMVLENGETITEVPAEAEVVDETIVIGSVVHVNETCVTINPVATPAPTGVKAIHVCQGQASVELKTDEPDQGLCLTDTECSSALVADASAIQTIEDHAVQALMDADIWDQAQLEDYKIHKQKARVPDTEKHARLLSPRRRRAARALLSDEKAARLGHGLKGRALFYDYGCCSGGLVLGGADGADCSVSSSAHHIQDNWLSEQCITHDVCLKNAGNNCNAKGRCDAAANTAVRTSRRDGPCSCGQDCDCKTMCQMMKGFIVQPNYYKCIFKKGLGW